MCVVFMTRHSFTSVSWRDRKGSVFSSSCLVLPTIWMARNESGGESSLPRCQCQLFQFAQMNETNTRLQIICRNHFIGSKWRASDGWISSSKRKFNDDKQFLLLHPKYMWNINNTIISVGLDFINLKKRVEEQRSTAPRSPPTPPCGSANFAVWQCDWTSSTRCALFSCRPTGWVAQLHLVLMRTGLPCCFEYCMKIERLWEQLQDIKRDVRWGHQWFREKGEATTFFHKTTHGRPSSSSKRRGLHGVNSFY